MNKAATKSLFLLLPIIHNKFFRSGISSILTLIDKFEFVYYGIPFKPFNPFLEIFNFKVAQLFEAGLTEYWIKNFQNPKGFSQKVDKIGPEILTMEHLEVGFLVWLISLTLSIVVFVVEILAKRLNKFVLGKKVLKYFKS